MKGDESIGSKEFYGILNDIIKVHYTIGNKVILFKYHLWDMYGDRGHKKDGYRHITTNTKHSLDTNKPYVLASQVEQEYYMRDNKNHNWLLLW